MIIDFNNHHAILKCDYCNVQFTRIKSQVKGKLKHYCCSAHINMGKKHTEKFKRHLSQLNSGVNNKFYGKKHTNISLEIMSLKSKGVKLSDERKKHLSEINSGFNNHFYGKKHTDSARKKMSETKAEAISLGKISAGPRGLKGLYVSSKTNVEERFDSFYELLRMKMLDLDDSVISWTKKHNIRISYIFETKNKVYIPDFLIVTKTEKILEEIKGYEASEKLSAKLRCLSEFCNKNNFVLSFLDANSFEKQVLKSFGKSIRFLREEYKKCV